MCYPINGMLIVLACSTFVFFRQGLTEKQKQQLSGMMVIVCRNQEPQLINWFFCEKSNCWNRSVTEQWVA